MSEQRWRTIPELVDAAARRFGSAEALVDDPHRSSFAELADLVHRCAGVLRARGIDPGDRVAIWAPNIWEFVVAALGVHAAGGVLVPINTRFKGHEAGYVLERSRAKILFTVTDFLETDYVDLLVRADATGSVGEIVVLRGACPAGTTAFEDLMADGGSSDLAGASVEPGDLCHIMFTSGTTGAPKGAMLTHAAVCRAYEAWSTVVGLRADDRYLIVNPFFHSFGLNAGILACLMTGATMIPHPVFDVPSLMARIPEERISMLPGAPAIYQTILNHPDLDRFDMSHLRLAVTGAAPIATEMIVAMRERLGFETIITGYGLTEASGIATMCRDGDPPEIIAHTSGRAIPDVEVAVVDDDGVEVPRGQPGEVVVRGYNVMVGYLDDPEQTAEVIDDDGWLHTGDIGVMDTDGYLDITDRKKDMYIVGGFNAYPAEIEAVMLAHPAIGQVAVIGVPDDRLGEVGAAFVVAAPGREVIEAEVVAWCRERLANYKVPRSVHAVDALPLNASGKVLKYELRERATSS